MTGTSTRTMKIDTMCEDIAEDMTFDQIELHPKSGAFFLSFYDSLTELYTETRQITKGMGVFMGAKIVWNERVSLGMARIKLRESKKAGPTSKSS